MQTTPGLLKIPHAWDPRFSVAIRGCGSGYSSSLAAQALLFGVFLLVLWWLRWT
jgi:hypothetical protein